MTPYWQSDDGRITLYHGDCLEIMRELPDGCVDCVITDPPYDTKTHEGARYGFRKTSSEIPFAPLVDTRFVQDCLRIAERWVLCFCALEMYGDYKQTAGDAWVRAGFWRRRNGVPQFTGDRPGQPGEGIAIMHNPNRAKVWNSHGKHGYWDFCIEQAGRQHPTQKPLPLMSSLILDFAQDEGTILDPFMGSGTTGVACVKTGRRFIGIEIDEGYCAIAKKRIVDALAQPMLALEAPCPTSRTEPATPTSCDCGISTSRLRATTCATGYWGTMTAWCMM
jgi:site-specific DNA-methyltransferase (adenine-specific)